MEGARKGSTKQQHRNWIAPSLHCLALEIFSSPHPPNHSLQLSPDSHYYHQHTYPSATKYHHHPKSAHDTEIWFAMWAASKAPNPFKEPSTNLPTSIEEYRSTIANWSKYEINRIQRAGGEEIPETQDERSRLKPLLSQPICLTRYSGTGVQHS